MFLLVLNAENFWEWSTGELSISSSQQPPATHPATLRLAPVSACLKIGYIPNEIAI